MTLSRRSLALATLAAPALVAPALAQGRPVTVVVAYPAGGDTDALARIFAERLSPRIGRNVVIENRSGASGGVGSIHVARATPDGDTLLFAPSTFPIVPHVLRAANYQPVTDFTPIIMTGTSPLLLVASAQSGLRTLADVRAAAQAGRLANYGSPGSGSPMHLFAEMFNHATGMRLQEVAYRGVAPVINDLLAGVLQLGWVTPGAVFQHLRANTMVPVAVTERARSPILPAVPTFVESGFDIDISAWWGFFGPAGLPAPLVATLNRHLNEIIRLPEVEARTSALGVVTGGGDPAALTRYNGGDYEKFGRVVRELNIRVE